MKKIFISLAVLAAAAVAIVAVNAENRLDEQFEANLEALAGIESGGEVVKCYCKTKWFSPNVCSANADGAYCGGNPCSNHDGNCR